MNMDSGTTAAVLSMCGVVITGLLTALTAIRSGKDKRERSADRRKIEEETTDVILKRVRKELDRAYEAIDKKDAQLYRVARWFDSNRVRLNELGIAVPELQVDEGPVSQRMHEVRLQIDEEEAREDEDDMDDLIERDHREKR